MFNRKWVNKEDLDKLVQMSNCYDRVIDWCRSTRHKDLAESFIKLLKGEISLDMAHKQISGYIHREISIRVGDIVEPIENALNKALKENVELKDENEALRKVLKIQSEMWNEKVSSEGQ